MATHVVLIKFPFLHFENYFHTLQLVVVRQVCTLLDANFEIAVGVETLNELVCPRLLLFFIENLNLNFNIAI